MSDKHINLDFARLLRKMHVKRIKYSPLYEKAFLDREEKTAEEYNQNTTTWD